MVTTKINLKIPFPIADKGIYNVSVDGKKAVIEIKHLQNHGSLELVLGMKVNATGSGGVSLSRDDYGIANISDVEIKIPYEIKSTPIFKMINGKKVGPQDDYDFAVEEECIKYLNRLVDTVRVNTKQYWLRSISRREINISNIEELDKPEGMPKEIVSINFGGEEYFPIRTFEQTQVQNKIKEDLENEKEISTHILMQLDAINYYSMRHYNEAIITINIAVELFTTQRIFKKLLEKFEYEDAKQELDKIVGARFRKIVDSQFKRIIGHTLQESGIWDDFIKARELRANAVHPYHKEIKKEECQKTFEVLGKVMQWIDAVCSNADLIIQPKEKSQT